MLSGIRVRPNAQPQANHELDVDGVPPFLVQIAVHFSAFGPHREVRAIEEQHGPRDRRGCPESSADLIRLLM